MERSCRNPAPAPSAWNSRTSGLAFSQEVAAANRGAQARRHVAKGGQRVRGRAAEADEHDTSQPLQLDGCVDELGGAQHDCRHLRGL